MKSVGNVTEVKWYNPLESNLKYYSRKKEDCDGMQFYFLHFITWKGVLISTQFNPSYKNKSGWNHNLRYLLLFSYTIVSLINRHSVCGYFWIADSFWPNYYRKLSKKRIYDLQILYLADFDGSWTQHLFRISGITWNNMKQLFQTFTFQFF